MGNTPNIRFKGFTDDWEQRKFSDVFTGLQNNTLSRSELNYESGTVKNVHYGDVLIKFGDYIDASKEELPFINDDSKVEKFKGSFLHNGDIVIADTAEDETVGKCTEIQGVDDIKLISGLHTIPCRPKEEYGAKFLGYYMNSSAYHAQLIPLMQGIKVTSISKSALQDTNMIIPKSVDEQTIIGEYFSNLDHLITLHQRKQSCNTLFINVWEQRKLLSCIQSITDFRGRTPKKLGMDWSESGYLALSALNVKDGYIDFSQDVHYGNQELYDKWMSGKELHRGQVLFTTEAPMGNVAQVPDNKGYILSQRTIAFDVEEEILSENFLATLLRTPNVFNDLTALSSGGTAKGVSQKSLSGLDVVIPKNIDEQNKLADYFINLDNLITLHRRAYHYTKRRTYK